VIKSFGDKRTEHIFEGRYVKRLDNELQRKTLRRLRYIDAAQKIDDLRIPPSNKLEKKVNLQKDYELRVAKRDKLPELEKVVERFG